MVVRLFLIVLFFPAFFIVVRLRTARFRAIRILMLIGLMFTTSYSILFPGSWQEFAELLGVGKGSDLLLYVLSVAFITFVGLVIRKLRDIDFRTSLVVQEIALQNMRHPGDTEPKNNA
jgi:hypothetical protein